MLTRAVAIRPPATVILMSSRSQACNIVTWQLMWMHWARQYLPSSDACWACNCRCRQKVMWPQQQSKGQQLLRYTCLQLFNKATFALVGVIKCNAYFWGDGGTPDNDCCCHLLVAEFAKTVMHPCQKKLLSCICTTKARQLIRQHRLPVPIWAPWLYAVWVLCWWAWAFTFLPFLGTNWAMQSCSISKHWQ